ncbi:uncharacterized protein B0P05DRAFT_570478 [Gilbertella persicaria]|uniref:uncharacterized protein n=1 Tax=Gilbertella persicaria TaxID=101096 RepID=UPI002220743D|nr:uncharacterized protein B0P05DRAFT_570478 [Gilbertella persicaria]KAI8084078.1 hypothetical protein B0P05DRAFT_570478 [Gilbertella persicaria]
MKFSALAVAAFATAASTVSATITLIQPWASTTWTAGQAGTVQWSSSADLASKYCEIHLLTTVNNTVSFVSNFTANGNLIPCTYTSANFHPLPDYPAGQYSIRMGPNGESTDSYAYSGEFPFVGQGSVAI